MMTQNTDAAQTWRDYEDQLTPQQVKALTHWEEIGVSDGHQDAYREYLVVEAREFIADNKRDAELNARVQPPAGAKSVGSWDGVDKTGRLSRSVQWATFDAGPTTVDLDGRQDDTGAVDGPHLSVYGLESTGRLGANDARRLAAALTEAAAKLERLQ